MVFQKFESQRDRTSSASPGEQGWLISHKRERDNSRSGLDHCFTVNISQFHIMCCCCAVYFKIYHTPTGSNPQIFQFGYGHYSDPMTQWI